MTRGSSAKVRPAERTSKIDIFLGLNPLGGKHRMLCAGLLCTGAVMNDRSHETSIETDIAKLNGLTTPQLEARFTALTNMPAPREISRSLLITAVAYEILRKPHRERIRHVA